MRFLKFLTIAAAILLLIPCALIAQHEPGPHNEQPVPPAAVPTAPEQKKEPQIAVPKPPAVEIAAITDRREFVGNQHILLKILVVFPQNATPFWEELKKLELAPFRIEAINLGERKIFDKDKDLNRDLREATVMLSLPASLPCGKYTIPEIKIGYSYFVDKKEVRKTARTKPIEVEKVPILVTFSVEKDVVPIGDINTFQLTIWREEYIRILNYELSDDTREKDEGFVRWMKSLEVRGQQITNLEKPSFPNFRIIKKRLVTENYNGIQKEIFEYRFAFYELGGKEFKTPSLHIWYLDAKKEQQKPAEIIIPGQPIKVNLVVRPGREELEGLKSSESRSSKHFLSGSVFYKYITYAGFILLGTCLVIAIKRSWKPKQKTECLAPETHRSVQELKENLLKLGAATPSQEIMKSARNSLAQILGHLLQLPVETTLSKSKTAIMQLLEKKFPENQNWLRETSSCLELLEKAIQDCDSGTDLAAINAKLEKILSAPQIIAECGKKKFSIF